MTWFISTRKNIISKQLAQVLIREVFFVHEFLESIVSDRESVFASSFWANLLYMLHVARDMSIAFHSQTNDQTERLNSVLEQYLRAYIDYDQTNWVYYLLLTKFAYNNFKHSTTRKFSFQVVYNRDSKNDFRDFAKLNDDVDREISILKQTERMKTTKKFVRQSLKKTQQYQTAYYNKKHISKIFVAKQKVWLDLRDIKTNHSSKKLNLRRIESCRVIKKMSSQIYQLNLSSEFRTHNVFHVSKIHANNKLDEVNFKTHHAIREVSNENQEFVIRELIDFFKKRNQLSYKIRWADYEEKKKKYTMKSYRNVKHLTQKLRQFHFFNSDKSDYERLIR